MLYTAVNIYWFTVGVPAVVLLYHDRRLSTHESSKRGIGLNCL
jgi:hypothetical protein